MPNCFEQDLMPSKRFYDGMRELASSFLDLQSTLNVFTTFQIVGDLKLWIFRGLFTKFIFFILKIGEIIKESTPKRTTTTNVTTTTTKPTTATKPTATKPTPKITTASATTRIIPQSKLFWEKEEKENLNYCSEFGERWLRFDKFCYKVFSFTRHVHPKSWIKSRDFCKSQGAHLASIHSDEEKNFLKSQVSFVFNFTEYNTLFIIRKSHCPKL